MDENSQVCWRKKIYKIVTERERETRREKDQNVCVSVHLNGCVCVGEGVCWYGCYSVDIKRESELCENVCLKDWCANERWEERVCV